MPASERTALRDRLAGVVREAGELALATAKTPYKRWMKSGSSSPVSEADIAVNDFLLEKLPALAPGAGWLSEETEDDLRRTETKQVWVVDPIDGTRAFIEERPDWTISVALVESGRPMLAALYAPVTDQLYLAAQGEGATLNGARLTIDGGGSLSGARVAGPKSYLAKMTQMNPRILPQPKVYSLALRLARVADGGLDVAFASRNSHDWDLAAADLIVHESGGALTDFTGQKIAYNRRDPVHGALIATGPARHAGLIDLLRDRRGEFA